MSLASLLACLEDGLGLLDLGTDLGTGAQAISANAAISAICPAMMADKSSALRQCLRPFADLRCRAVDHTQEHTEVSALELAEVLEGFGVVHQPASSSVEDALLTRPTAGGA